MTCPAADCWTCDQGRNCPHRVLHASYADGGESVRGHLRFPVEREDQRPPRPTPERSHLAHIASGLFAGACLVAMALSGRIA